MNRKAVRVISLVIAAAMIIGIMAAGVSYVFAATQSDIDASNQKVNEQKQKLNDIKDKQSLNAEDIENLKKETVTLQSQIDASDAAIAKTQKELETAEKELEAAKKKSDNQYEAYKERFRAMCEEGAASYLEMIFSSESLMDFLDKIEIAQEISEYDKKIYDEMKVAENKIQKLTEDIAAKKTAQEQEKSNLTQKQKELSQKQSELEEVKQMLQTDAAAAQAIIDEELKKQEALKAQMAPKLSSTTDGTVYSGGDFVWPATSTYITSSFSPARVNPVTGILKAHTGVDIGAAYGTAVMAAAGGTVKYSGWNGGYGNCIIIDHGGGRSTLYGHMSSLSASVGQTVSAGQTIGRVGSTGNSTGPHLHFEILINGSAVDPMQYF